MLDAASCWMLVVCVFSGCVCFGLIQWLEYKRSVASGEFRRPPSQVNHPNPWPSDPDRFEEERRRDIEKNLQVGEWLPKDERDPDTDEESLDPIDIEALEVADNDDDPMEQLREASKLVSPSHVMSSGECAICLALFKVHDIVCEANHLDCVHVFHAECMKEWLLYRESCPICRSPYL